MPPFLLLLLARDLNARQAAIEIAVATFAEALNLPLAQPNVNGLAIRDEAHLNRPSAERWGAALMRALDPLLDHCLAVSPR